MLVMLIKWRLYFKEHYVIYTWQPTVKLIILKEENFKCPDIFNTQPGPVAKNATLGHPAGSQTHNL